MSLSFPNSLSSRVGVGGPYGGISPNLMQSPKESCLVRNETRNAKVFWHFPQFEQTYSVYISASPSPGGTSGLRCFECGYRKNRPPLHSSLVQWRKSGGASK